MNILFRFIISFIIAGFYLNSPTTFAEEKKVSGYTIYYNAFNSSFLQPQVAKSYKIPRSAYTGVINVSVHKDNDSSAFTALPANVQGKATNNLSQYEELAFREIKEENAIYYLADFQFRDKESINISVIVRIPGKDTPVTLELDQKFFAN